MSVKTSKQKGEFACNLYFIFSLFLVKYAHFILQICQSLKNLEIFQKKTFVTESLRSFVLKSCMFGQSVQKLFLDRYN